jgi:hypothetical protein
MNTLTSEGRFSKLIDVHKNHKIIENNPKSNLLVLFPQALKVL